jgi:outer membrane receptor protein involved in Fe transport
MRKINQLFGCFLALCFITNIAIAQNSSTVVSGSVKNKGKEGVGAVSVSIKGKTTGTYTDDKGNFKFSTTQKPPFTLVFSSVGYSSKEVNYTGSDVSVELAETYVLGDEIVVAASRVPEKILESPVSIERIGNPIIRTSPASSYYDIIGNLKGVDLNTASLTFKTVTTRGFSGSGNTRFNQFVDGMDNQAPGLNFSVGNFAGLTELDVDNMELLSGASSALYGPGGMNGTLLINSKSPFKYQGLSYQVKMGVNHIDNKQRDRSPFYDWSVRYAKKINDKWAYKIGAQLVQAQDWLATDAANYLPQGGVVRPTGMVIGGNRASDPNYDGVNVYGDETTTNLGSTIFPALRAQIYAGAGLSSAQQTAFNGAMSSFFASQPSATLAQFNSFLTSIGGGALTAGNPAFGGLSPSAFFWGNGRGFYNNVNVSRTGYTEGESIDPNTTNVKLSGALHHKINDKLEASIVGHFGFGNTVYTSSDRYALRNLRIGQYKAELKGETFYVRAYMTLEDAGDSYITTIANRIFNESWKPSTTWFPQYMVAYTGALAQGAPTTTAHNAGRSVADVGRPTGFLPDNAAYQKIVQTPISQGGALFTDQTSLYQLEGQWNLTKILKLPKTTDILVGGTWRQFWLDSRGTLFADRTAIQPGKIRIDEKGAYLQVTQKLFNEKLKLQASGRYDKNENFEPRFTPRVALVFKAAEGHNFRASYQTAYRFPTTQNQWINLQTAGGILLGGLPQLRNGLYQFNTNPAYTAASVAAFGASGNPALLQVQQFGEFKPESSTSYEVGYKGLFNNKLLVDAYYYMSSFENFISGVNVVQSTTGSPAGLANSATRRGISVSTNATGIVKTSGWGVSAEYLLPNNFSVSANIYSDVMNERPTDVAFIDYFNTPKYRTNITFGNSGFIYNKRIGFSIVYRWQDEMYFQGLLGSGQMPAFQTFDAVATYKFPKTKSIFKIGGTNIFNKYYRNGFANPQIGGLYYASFAYNVF